MQRMIQLAAILAVLLVVAPLAPHTAAASTPTAAQPARLSGSFTRTPPAAHYTDRSPAMATQLWRAEAPDSADKTGEVVNGLLGALLLALSVMTLCLLGRRRRVR